MLEVVFTTTEFAEALAGALVVGAVVGSVFVLLTVLYGRSRS